MNNLLADYSSLRESEDRLIRKLLNSSTSSLVEKNEEKDFDPFEEHICKGGCTETWLIPGGREFWLIFKGDPQLFTWIEYCPYCGYHPANLNINNPEHLNVYENQEKM